MAAITILRGLNEQGGDGDYPLVSAFTQNSIEFKFERGTETNTYAKVELNGTSFFATLVEANYETNTDRYIIDLTTKLPHLLGVAPLDTSSSLTTALVIDIKGYSSADVLLATNTAHPDIELTFAYPLIGTGGGLNSLYGTGAMRTIYHNGFFSVYISGVSGSQALTVDGGTTTQTITLAETFNLIEATTNLLKSGTLEIESVYEYGLSVPIVYRAAPADSVELWWINRDGCWSVWNFREIQKRYSVEKSEKIPIYGLTNAMMKGKSYDLNTSKDLIYDLDTVAVNADHYAQLCEIAESPRIIYRGVVCRISSISDTVANCRQNLKFNVSLKAEENAVSY